MGFDAIEINPVLYHSIRGMSSQSLSIPCTNIVVVLECVCTKIGRPVCGENGVTYGNPCGAECAGVEVECDGECPCKGKNGYTGCHLKLLKLFVMSLGCPQDIIQIEVDPPPSHPIFGKFIVRTPTQPQLNLS